MMKKILGIATLSYLICLLYVACIPETVNLPYRINTVRTKDVANVTDVAAVLYGSIELIDNDTIVCGIMYGDSLSLSSKSGTRKAITSTNGDFFVAVTDLEPKTQYFYCAFALDAREYKYGSVCSFQTKEANSDDSSSDDEEPSTPKGAEAIDLGLSVKWANFNVGATSPEEYGYYFAWGETEEKSEYSWSTYKWCDGSASTQTKYCTDSYHGIVDNKTTLEPEDDVARVLWGSAWRMPTSDEIKELVNVCDWEWTTINGVNGYQVTGPNGNSTFLPAAGLRSGEDVEDRGSAGYYWSATMSSSFNDFAYNLDENKSGLKYRYYGIAIRPVSDNSKQIISVTTGDVLSVTDSEAILSGTVHGTKQSVSCGIIYGTSSILFHSTGSMKYTSSTGDYTVTVRDLNSNTTYYYRAFAFTDGEYKYGDVQTFKTASNVTVTSGDAIDLGLSVKWASCNVGANSPEEYGDYFAWGETEAKSGYYESNSATFWLSISQLKSNGVIDSDGNLTADYDAATMNLGNDWRMPTEDEIRELLIECYCEWTMMNGVNGYKVTGPNGNSIFLPAVGYRSGTSLVEAESLGYYWSSTPLDGSYRAYDLYFDSEDCYRDGYFRDFGLAVRPVSDK